LEPDNTIAYLNRAMLNQEIGNYTGAIEDLDVVLGSASRLLLGYYSRSYLKRNWMT